MPGRLAVGFDHGGQDTLLIGDLKDQRISGGGLSVSTASEIDDPWRDRDGIALLEIQRREIQRPAVVGG